MKKIGLLFMLCLAALFTIGFRHSKQTLLRHLIRPQSQISAQMEGYTVKSITDKVNIGESSTILQ